MTDDLISRAEAIEILEHLSACKEYGIEIGTDEETYIGKYEAITAISDLPSVEKWIPCSERLPKVNQNVLLCTNDGKVFVGHRDKPELIWQITEEDGRKHWVYDPENYTDDVDGLPKAEDCAFDKDEYYADGYLSVTSMNYDERFVGIIAWMPLPEPYEAKESE